MYIFYKLWPPDILPFPRASGALINSSYARLFLAFSARSIGMRSLIVFAVSTPGGGY